MSDSPKVSEPRFHLDKEVVRRDFIRTMFTGGFLLWVGAFLYPVFRYLKPREEEDTTNAVQSVVAGKVAEIRNAHAKLFKFGTKPAWVFENEKKEIVAMIATCSHLGCTVTFYPDKERFICGCHGGTYDTTGKNIAGPPPKPLTPLKVTIAGDDVVVGRA